MQLDPGKRYLLSRPRGGFNDAMVQLEKSAMYAEKYGRVLLLDMSRSGLRAQIDDIFDLRGGLGCAVLPWRDDMGPALDAASSVFPSPLLQRVSTYEAVWNPTIKNFSDRASGQAIDFDHAQDHEAQVLVYEQAGGGYASLNGLRRLSMLRAEIADQIVSRLIPLGRGYDAVHLRHSDYETDFEAFLLELRPTLRGRRVLICSDSREAKDAAVSILHPSTTVLSVSDIPDLGGVPLFEADKTVYGDSNIDLLGDLVAMAMADTVYFTKLSGGNDNGVRYSGFSLLADMLRRYRDVVRQLLALADPYALQAVFAKSPICFDPVQKSHRCVYFWNNFEARRKAFSRNRRANRRRITPEKIGPTFRG